MGHGKAQSAIHAAPASHRVLVVDDEPAILFAYKRLIEGQGMSVDVCEDLNAAMNLISDHPYDVVISDIRLGGSDNSDGLEILAAIRSTQRPRVIVTTGYGKREARQAARELGVSFYFEKPVLPAAILKALRSCLEEQQAA